MNNSNSARFVVLSAVLATPGLWAQDVTPEPATPDTPTPLVKRVPTEEPPAVDSVPAWQMKFENLPPEKRNEYSKLIGQASQLFNQKRIFEALK